MKKTTFKSNFITIIALFSALFLITSCGVKKEFKSQDDFYESVKGHDYDDFVEAWGEPTSKDDLDIEDKGINVVWNSPSFKISGVQKVTLQFDVFETSWHSFLPTGTVRRARCDDDWMKARLYNN